MSISDAYVKVNCDCKVHSCGVEEEVELTALAGHGEYDMRDVVRKLERGNWTVGGGALDGETLCEDCVHCDHTACDNCGDCTDCLDCAC